MTIDGWARFVADQLRGARGEAGLLKPETYKILHTPPFGGDYALGWATAEREWGGGRVLTHNGSNTMNFRRRLGGAGPGFCRPGLRQSGRRPGGRRSRRRADQALAGVQGALNRRRAHGLAGTARPRTDAFRPGLDEGQLPRRMTRPTVITASKAAPLWVT